MVGNILVIRGDTMSKRFLSFLLGGKLALSLSASEGLALIKKSYSKSTAAHSLSLESRYVDLAITGLKRKDEVALLTSIDKNDSSLYELNPSIKIGSKNLKVFKLFSVIGKEGGNYVNSFYKIGLSINYKEILKSLNDRGIMYLQAMVAPDAVWDWPSVRFSDLMMVQCSREYKLYVSNIDGNVKYDNVNEDVKIVIREAKRTVITEDCTQYSCEEACTQYDCGGTY